MVIRATRKTQFTGQGIGRREQFQGSPAAGAEARAIGRIGEIASQQIQRADEILLRKEREAVELNVRTTSNELQALQRKLTIEARNTKGADADGISRDTEVKFNEQYSKASLTLGERERALFESTYQPVMDRYLSQVFDHEETERIKFSNDQKQATVALALTDTASNAYNIPARTDSLARAVANTKSLWENASPEVIEQKVLDTKTRGHSGVINSMLVADDPRSAEEYFKNYASKEGEMLPSVRAETEKIISARKKALESFGLANSIYAQNPDDKEKQNIALREATKDDPEARTSARRELDAMNRADEIAKTQRYNAQMDSKIDEILDADSPQQAIAIADGMQGKMRLQLLKIASDVSQTGGIRTEYNTYQKLKRMPHEKFLKVNLAKDYRHLLSDTDLRSMINEQTEEKNTLRPTFTRTINRNIADTAERIELNPNSKNKEVLKKFDEFDDEIQARISQLEAEKGRRITPGEADKIIEQVQVETVLKRSGEVIKGDSFLGITYDPDKSYEEAQADGTDATWLPDVVLTDIEKDRMFRAFSRFGQRQGNQKAWERYARDETAQRIYLRSVIMKIPLSAEVKALGNDTLLAYGISLPLTDVRLAEGNR